MDKSKPVSLRGLMAKSSKKHYKHQFPFYFSCPLPLDSPVLG